MKFYDCATAPSPRRVRITSGELPRGLGLFTDRVSQLIRPHAASMSVREKSPPLNRSGSPVVFESAYAKQSPKFSAAG